MIIATTLLLLTLEVDLNGKEARHYIGLINGFFHIFISSNDTCTVCTCMIYREICSVSYVNLEQ